MTTKKLIIKTIVGFAVLFCLNACSNAPTIPSKIADKTESISPSKQSTTPTGCSSKNEMGLDKWNRGPAYFNQPLIYPEESKRLNEVGKVIVKAFVNVEGHAENAEISKSSGFPILDQTAIDAVKKWCFLPALKDGKPFSAWVLLPIRFDKE